MSGRERGVDAVFQALADPTRRAVVRLLSDGPGTATEIADRLPVSRQAVSKHLAALDEAGLVTGERTGREVRYRLTPRQIEQRIEAKFKLPDTKQNRQRIYELTQKLRRRREEYDNRWIEEAAEKGRTIITKEALRQYKQVIGDHDHMPLEDGSTCPICGEVINR